MTRARDLAAFVSNADGDIKFDTDTLFIDSSANRVGIGTTTPQEALHLKSADPSVRFEDTSGDAYAQIDTDSADEGTIRIQADPTNVGANSIIRFDTDGSERMRINADGRVGIGLNPFASTGYNLQIGGTSQSFISIHNTTTGNTVNDGFSLGNDASNVFITNRENTPMRFATNNLERMRILAGGGLTFNGDTAADNALDDYEQGFISSTNILRATSSNPTISISANRSVYVKIGTFVRAHFDFSFTCSSQGSGDLKLTVPFSVDGAYSFNSIHAARNNSAFTGIRDYEINGYGQGSDIFLLYSTGTAGAEAAINSSVLPTSGSVRINLDFNYKST